MSASELKPMVWKKLSKKDLAHTKEHFAASGYVMQWYAMASEVILMTLGPEWWEANCSPGASSADHFLMVNDRTKEGQYDHQDRVIKLGHMLYALKTCEGFPAFIASLKSRDLAPTFFELWVANILTTNDYEVVFVETTGVRGSDYDLIASRDGQTLSVEAKSRRSGPILNQKTLSNALTKARKQLPRTGPGVIFVQIPVEWTMNDDVELVVGDAMAAFFRNTSRVNGVVICWHKWIDLASGRASTTLVRRHYNPKPRVLIQLGGIISPVCTSIPPDLSSQDFRPSFW